VRSSIIVGLIIGAVLAAIAAYFLPERETTITRDVRAEELRRTVSVVRPFVKELKDFKELRK
jgi:gas vesicle protein